MLQLPQVAKTRSELTASAGPSLRTAARRLSADRSLVYTQASVLARILTGVH